MRPLILATAGNYPAARSRSGIGPPRVGTYSEFAGATTSAVPFPDIVLPGDCLLLLGSVSNAAGAVVTPAGWTLVAHQSIAANTINPTLCAYLKTATGTEGGTSLTVTHGSFSNSFQILAFSGVDTSQSLDTTTVIADPNVSSASLALGSIAPITPGAAIVCAAAQNATGNSAIPPSGFTEVGARISGARTHENSYKLGQVGDTGSLSVGWSAAAKAIGVLIALRPAVL